jgi:hypothetical protein
VVAGDRHPEQDTDDREDDQELDEGKAAFTPHEPSLYLRRLRPSGSG